MGGPKLILLILLILTYPNLSHLSQWSKFPDDCGEPLNEAADALASAAAEADDSQMAGELHLDPESVHFYLDGHPTAWGTQVRNRLTQEAAVRIAEELSGLARRR